MCVNLAMLVCKVVSGVKKNVDYPEKHEVFCCGRSFLSQSLLLT